MQARSAADRVAAERSAEDLVARVQALQPAIRQKVMLARAVASAVEVAPGAAAAIADCLSRGVADAQLAGGTREVEATARASCMAEARRIINAGADRKAGAEKTAEVCSALDLATAGLCSRRHLGLGVQRAPVTALTGGRRGTMPHHVQHRAMCRNAVPLERRHCTGLQTARLYRLSVGVPCAHRGATTHWPESCPRGAGAVAAAAGGTPERRSRARHTA